MPTLTRMNDVWQKGQLIVKEGGTWRGISAVTTKSNGKWADIASPESALIFGVRIDINNPSPNDAVEYIDDAIGFTPMTRNDPGSWGGTSLVAGIRPVLRKSDGTWQNLNKRNLADGEDISSIGNDVFTRFPTWWLSITSDEAYNYIRFSNKKVDDTYFKLASLYNGVDKGAFYLGCYHAYSSENKLYSSANKSPSVKISTEITRQYAQARGAGFDQVGWYQIMYLQALFILLFKGRNGQELIGKGNTGPGSIAVENRTIYDNDFGMAGSSSGTDQMAFFWINNWWGNVSDLIGGVKTNADSKLMTQTDGKPIVSTSSDAGYETYNTTMSSYVSGWTQQMEGTSTKVGFFPKSFEGNQSKYQNWCDHALVYPSMFPIFGGAYGNGDDAGPFHWVFSYVDYSEAPYVGSRLVYREAVN